MAVLSELPLFRQIASPAAAFRNALFGVSAAALIFRHKHVWRLVFELLSVKQ
jgi:hypothetical protein